MLRQSLEPVEIIRAIWVPTQPIVLILDSCTFSFELVYVYVILNYQIAHAFLQSVKFLGDDKAKDTKC